MLALAFVCLPGPGRALRAGDRRHQADRLQVQGPHLLSRAWATSTAVGRTRSSSAGSLPRHLSREPEDRRIPRAGPIWPLVYQDPVPPRPRRRVAGPAGESHRRPKAGPSRLNWFGTNQQGFDVFAQMVHGTQIALLVGFVSMGIAGADRHHGRRPGRLLRRLGRHAAQPPDRSRDVHPVAGADPGARGDARSTRQSGT